MAVRGLNGLLVLFFTVSSLAAAAPAADARELKMRSGSYGMEERDIFDISLEKSADSRIDTRSVLTASSIIKDRGIGRSYTIGDRDSLRAAFTRKKSDNRI